MMAPLVGWSWTLDGWIIAAGVLCAVSAALLGNFLVLRRMSLLGDAISHAVLPGLAAAFFLTGERSSLAMFVGAVIVGILTALFTEWVSRYGQVDEGASLGVVFTSLFAAGLVMIVQAADRVDLDPGCVLYGAIELTPLDTWRMAGIDVPRVVVMLGVVTLVNLTYVVVLFKELKLAAFDPALATSAGYSPAWLHYSLTTLVAVTAVACFESVGNILVVAMLVTPPATARLLTDRLATMVTLSVVIAAASAVVGHAAAVETPAWFGLRSTSTAGMMAVAAGGFFTLAALFAPHQGVVVKAFQQARLSARVLGEDILGLLFRAGEQQAGAPARLTANDLRQKLLGGGLQLRTTLAILTWRRLVEHDAQGYGLTPTGAAAARELVRSHRLWESYLVERAGVPLDRIHGQAERFEHVTDRDMRDRLDQETSVTATDPHGAEIPSEPPADRQP